LNTTWVKLPQPLVQNGNYHEWSGVAAVYVDPDQSCSVHDAGDDAWCGATAFKHLFQRGSVFATRKKSRRLDLADRHGRIDENLLDPAG
jgi:hypothetical protein